MQWTQTQTEAIEKRNCNLLISAGAGSGKTAVLTERITRLIAEDKIEADRIVVLTFTKAAASEMKRRIRQSLRLKARESEDADHLRKQIQKLEKAQISTIHSFCLNLIKKYYFVIDADPSASVLRDAESVILKQEALESLFEDKYESNDEAFLTLSDLYSPGNDDAPLKEHIVSLYEFICNRPQPWEWLEDACAAFGADEEQFEQLPAAIFLRAHADSMLGEALRLGFEALRLCGSCDEDGRRTAYLEEMTDQLGRVRKASNISLRALFDAMESYTMPKFDIRTSCARSDEIKALRAGAKELYDDLKGLFGFSYDTVLCQLNELEVPMRTLSDAVREYAARYRTLKAEKSGIDYTDMEQNCLEILRDDAAAQEIRNSFDYVFVDEYQDTNAIQEEIICRISRADNLFAVGDIKQSIYRFREAEPEIFLSRYHRYENSGDPLSALIFLTENFRTQPDIIHALNDVFSGIMFSETGGVDYDPNEKLRVGKTAQVRIKPEIRVVEMPQIADGTEDGSDVSDLSETLIGYKKQEIEAAHVAKLVKELLTQELYDETQECMRAVRLSDIAIVGRSMKSNAAYYADALKSIGIESASEQSERYYDETEVALMIALLQVIDNEKNDLPLLGVMRSFLFGFDTDELLRIRLAQPTCTYYHEALCAYRENGDDPVLAAKIGSMLARIAEYREMGKHMPIERMMRAIYTDTDILTYVGCLPNGRHRQENLTELLRLAAQYETSSLKGLYHFILYIEKCREHDTAPRTRQNTRSEEKVRLLTVHKSKGLEFEIVIFVGCGNSFLKTELRSDLVCHKDLGICPTYYDMQKFYGCDTIFKSAAKVAIDMENKAEEMRILYVGATRAKQRLYFVGTVKYGNGARLLETGCRSKYEIRSANHYLEWLLGGILSADSDPINEIPQEEGSAFENSLWRISIHAASDTYIVQSEDVRADRPCEIDPQKGMYYDKVSTLLDFRYPHALSARIPSKMTVSELKDAEILRTGEKLIAMQIAPKFVSSEESNSGARIGTLVHRVLLHLNLTRLHAVILREELSAQLAVMADEGIFSAAEAALIDLDMLCTFFESEVGCALLEAEEVHREMPFIMRMPAGEIDAAWTDSGENILVQGVIDCWFRTGGRTFLLDYKTDRTADESSFVLRKAKYTAQIRLYARALTEITGESVDASVICFLAMNRYVSVNG